MTTSKTTPLVSIGTKHIRCGYPLCRYFDERAPVLTCPMPIKDSACMGAGNPYEHYYGIAKPID
jgi:hypothetical protein